MNLSLAPSSLGIDEHVVVRGIDLNNLDTSMIQQVNEGNKTSPSTVAVAIYGPRHDNCSACKCS